MGLHVHAAVVGVRMHHISRLRQWNRRWRGRVILQRRLVQRRRLLWWRMMLRWRVLLYIVLLRCAGVRVRRRYVLQRLLYGCFVFVRYVMRAAA